MIDVYLSLIPDNPLITDVYPKLRDDEIKACTSQKVKNEKFWVWHTLERAAKEAFGHSFTDLSFSKNENGKWLCDRFCFSLSHTEGAVAVALFDKPVGIDIERPGRFENMPEEKLRRLMRSAFTENEIKAVASAEDFCRIWTAKESMFKCGDYKAFIPNKADTVNADKSIVYFDGFSGFAVSVCSDTYDRIRFRIY